MARSLIAATALAALAFAAAASAEESVVIDIVGVDFSDPAQASAIYSKVVEASETVCETLHLTDADYKIGYAERQRLYAACVENTIQETIATAEQPALAAIYASSSPSPSFAVASN